MVHVFLRAALIAVAATLAGCGSDQLPTYPVRGQLMAGGQPAANAFVVFHPQGDDERLRKLRPTGRVAGDGSFTLTTYIADDGAPRGEYVVTVEWPGIDPDMPASSEDSEAALSGPDRLQGRYQDAAASSLRATIVAGANTLPPIEVQLPTN